jgi:alpha-ketoglutarate-dependent 2,4-dichlorophenoxyacetate dioxygenase
MLSIRPLANTFAAEIRGIDIRNSPSEEVIAEIYDAFLAYGVIVLPGQAISTEQQLNFARHFGSLWQVPEWNLKNRRVDNPAIDDVSNLDKTGAIAGAKSEKVLFQLGNQLWHSDLSASETPAQASMLLALEVVPDGGETEFADLQGAYEQLPEPRRASLATLIAEHSLAHSRLRGGYGGLDVERIKKLMPPSFHPVVRIHSETGRRGLYIGAHAARVLGMSDKDGAALLDELTEFATQPRFVYRHRWAALDFVIWDNRRTLHRGRPYDADKYRRVMQRATVLDIGPTVSNGKVVEYPIQRRGPVGLSESAHV